MEDFVFVLVNVLFYQELGNKSGKTKVVVSYLLKTTENKERLIFKEVKLK